MEVPRYRRHRQQPNNVASIWLLRGTAKRSCFQDVAAAPQRRFVPRLTFFGSNLSIWSAQRPQGSRPGTKLAKM
jgi:hypothetical protein